MALKKHHLKKVNSLGSAWKIDEHKSEIFQKFDSNQNGMLTLSEYKEFCKHYCEVLSKELGVTFDEISEE
jgi:Ca2+-binding EF-hand superfamily protein